MRAGRDVTLVAALGALAVLGTVVSGAAEGQSAGDVLADLAGWVLSVTAALVLLLVAGRLLGSRPMPPVPPVPPSSRPPVRVDSWRVQVVDPAGRVAASRPLPPEHVGRVREVVASRE